MRKSFSIEETQFETQGNERIADSPTSFPAKSKDCRLGGVLHGLEVLLTSKETSQILRIHPKVVERMAQRGGIPALKVGKFWRYRATALDAWISSKLQPKPRCNSIRG
jgi:excisionase family DNA binding protein